MEQSVLEMLKRCYAGSREPVLLLDDKWNVLWQNVPLEIGYVPALLRIPEDFRETCQRNVTIGEACFRAQLLCNPADGVNILTLSPEPVSILPMETELLTNVAHSLYSLSNELHQVLDENELYDQMFLIKGIRGNCMRLYRPAYLQKELERLEAGLWKKECFSVQQQLQEMMKHIGRILGRSADVTLEPCGSMPMVRGDAEAFQIAVLSALVLCFQDREHRLEITIACKDEDDFCTLTVTVKPTPELRSDLSESLGDFGELYAEQKLLACFCESCGGSWMQGENGEARFCRITMPHCESGGSLMSFYVAKESKFFNKYEIMLARIKQLQ